MPRENPSNNIESLLKTLDKRLIFYYGLIETLRFSFGADRIDLMNKQKERWANIKSFIDSSSKDTQLMSIMPEYKNKFESLLNTINIVLKNGCPTNRRLTFKHYTLVLNYVGYYIGIFRYEAYINFIQHLEESYTFSLKNKLDQYTDNCSKIQAMNVRNIRIDTEYEEIIESLEIIKQYFEKIQEMIKDICNSRLKLEGIKNNTEKVFNQIAENSSEKYSNLFPQSIRILNRYIAQCHVQQVKEINKTIHNFRIECDRFDEIYNEAFEKKMILIRIP